MDFIPNEMCGMFWDKVLEYILISLIQSFTLDLSGFPHWNHLNSTRKNLDCCWVFSWWTIKRWWMNAFNISARSLCLVSFASVHFVSRSTSSFCFSAQPTFNFSNLLISSSFDSFRIERIKLVLLAHYGIFSFCLISSRCRIRYPTVPILHRIHPNRSTLLKFYFFTEDFSILYSNHR